MTSNSIEGSLERGVSCTFVELWLQIGCPDKSASVVSLSTAVTATTAIFANTDDHLSNWVEYPRHCN